MAHLLNYKFEIFPTKPQRQQFNKILRETKYQWNKGVTIWKKLRTSLNTGQIEHVVKTCLLAGQEKSDTNYNRKKAILKLQDTHKNIDLESASKLYDIKNLVGKIIEIDVRHLDVRVLSKELKQKHTEELSARKRAISEGIAWAKLPKLTVYWQLMRAIGQYAGFAAKTYMDKSFNAPDGMALSTIRFNISGSKNALRWNTAVQPKPQQRKYGARGEPQYKRRGESFAYQVQNTEIEGIIRRKNNYGYQVNINPLYIGNKWVDMAYHREIPKESKIKMLTVSEKAGHYFAVFSCEVPESAWALIPRHEGLYAGIDPGAETALTVGLLNSNTGELSNLAIHYGFLEKSLDKLEQMQQKLSQKHGPRRKRTEEEIQQELSTYAQKRYSSIQKLSPDERKKLLQKKKDKLEKTMVRQEASKRWKRWSRRVSELQFTIANQRKDILHKISHMLVKNCDLVGLGHWEPEREVSYRKKLRTLKKKVKRGIKGAAEELQALIEDKTKQGPKGVKKIRRGGRDRSIATLRQLIEEKSLRAGIKAETEVPEAGSTINCHICGNPTGPKKDLSVRVWRCTNCNTLHQRDLNSSFNILFKTLEIAAAQAATSETGSTVIRTMAQGATVLPATASSGSGHLAMVSSGKGNTNMNVQQALNGTNLWQKEVASSLKSLIQMGIARPISMQMDSFSGSQGPP